MKRTVIPELLDDDLGAPQEIAASLADLRRINRWFGGIATTESMVRRVVAQTGSRELSLLEVGAGSGDVPNEVRRRLSSSGIRLKLTLLDRQASHLSHGRHANGATAVVGDALSLPFSSGVFDVVSCGLFLHHLEPAETRQFAREALRVSRNAVLINDLDRNALHLALIYAGFPLHSRITRHDSVASVKRAYTAQEIREMLAPVAPRIQITHHYLFRLGVILWK